MTTNIPSRRSFLVSGANQGLGMHTVHQIAMTPDVVVFMGSRKLTAAQDAIAGFSSTIHPLSLVVPVQLDITDAISIANASVFVATYLKENNMEGLDVLINNAAVGLETTDLMKETFDVNVFGTAALTSAIRPIMNNGGAILNISSRMGSMELIAKLPIAMAPAYSSSKSAVNNLTVVWAREEEKRGSGIRVVSICPGFNATAINNYAGTMAPSDGCKIIVQTALEKEGRTGVFFNKDGDIPW
ncbi:Short-chain dehydrogenase/reductase family protein [Mycena indigotica]|uniref:Short-chain dehydrogenase/reductase family protein n=1 Tax=Mycena indigotica TaxID=2126181 RepID=A0A8H6VYT7_9AGAR|nr:Short-chain dehydrogenase/reductase family protein [Mycena indigotica]KAF7298802.1 Short-chain dehydrogenase/reductase family protein [Mycena indigotica]